MPLFVRIRPMNRAELGNATILRGSCTGLKGVGTPCQPGEPPPKTSHHPSPTLLTLQPCTSTGLSPPGTLDATLPPLHLLTDGIIMPTPTNPEEEQRGVFNLWSPHISACVLQGRSACCIAYGPSGACPHPPFLFESVIFRALPVINPFLTLLPHSPHRHGEDVHDAG